MPMTNLKTNATAGAPTPNGRQKSSAFLNAHADNTRFAVCATAQIDLDARLDDLIAIADATGTTLDAAVARLGTAPEAEWEAFRSTLAALISARPPSAIPDLHRAHQRICEAMAAKDENDPDLIDASAEIEGPLLAAQPVTLADAYRRLLALCPTLTSDLDAPELAALRAEIEALIRGEG